MYLGRWGQSSTQLDPLKLAVVGAMNFTSVVGSIPTILVAVDRFDSYQASGRWCVSRMWFSRGKDLILKRRNDE